MGPCVHEVTPSPLVDEDQGDLARQFGTLQSDFKEKVASLGGDIMSQHNIRAAVSKSFIADALNKSLVADVGWCGCVPIPDQNPRTLRSS